MQKYHKFRWTKGLHNAIIDYVCKCNKMMFAKTHRKREGEELRPEISRILEGDFEYEVGNIEFSCSRIEIELDASSVYEGEFSILASLDGAFYGTITTSDPRMVCHNPEFNEKETVIAFSFDASHMQPGDVEK